MDILVGLLAILCDEADNAGNLPSFACFEGGVAAPAALDAYHFAVDDSTGLSVVNVARESAGSIDGFGLVFGEDADAVSTIVGHDEGEGVVVVFVARITAVVVAGSDVAVVSQEVAAAEVEAVVAARVGHGHFNALVGFERNVLHGVSIHVGIASTRCFAHTVGNVALGHLLPRSGGEVLSREGMVKIPLVFFARSLAHGVVGCGVLKACENLVAHEHSAAGVTYDGRRAACGLGIYVVNHRDDVVHINVFALEFHLGAEIVATIAEHGAPNDLDVGTLIIIGIVGYEGFAIEVLSTAKGRCGTREVLHLYALKGHGRSGNGLACAETYGEGLGAGLEVHGLTASEEEGVAHLHETSLKHVIAQGVEVFGLRQIGFADSRLLLRIEHCIGVGNLVGLAGKVNDGNGHSLVDIVDRNGRKLAFGHYKLKVVLR